MFKAFSYLMPADLRDLTVRENMLKLKSYLIASYSRKHLWDKILVNLAIYLDCLEEKSLVNGIVMVNK